MGAPAQRGLFWGGPGEVAIPGAGEGPDRRLRLFAGAIPWLGDGSLLDIKGSLRIYNWTLFIDF